MKETPLIASSTSRPLFSEETALILVINLLLGKFTHSLRIFFAEVIPNEVREMANTMTVTPDDPGVIVVIGCDHAVHQALGLPGSPVPQGANPGASQAAFVAWLQQMLCSFPRSFFFFLLRLFVILPFAPI
jgi:hypothetical protein